MIPTESTSRYASNLLTNGSNADFTLLTCFRKDNIIRNQIVGGYYECDIRHLSETKSGVGATPLAAVKNALNSFGVSFK